MMSQRNGAVPTLAPQAEREPILDVLRGFAILGILLVNIQFMRGTDWMGVTESGDLHGSGISGEGVARFLIGWLASGKFLSSLALLFGIGAALIHRRAVATGHFPRSLLLRRYCILMVFGLIHMVLLYPGDILFVYGTTGLLLLAFVKVSRGTLFLSASALLLGYTFAVVALAARQVYAVSNGLYETFTPLHPLRHLHAEAIAAFSNGRYSDIVAIHASQALTLQGYQFTALPWILALFMLGYVFGRSRVLDDLAAHRALLRRGAALGLLIGLTVNIAVGYGGPLGIFPPLDEPGARTLLLIGTLAQALGTPVLAAGYLCALALYCLRRGAIHALAAVGRMALTAYLLQSALALLIVSRLRLYDELSTLAALPVVAAIWAFLLVACPAWLRYFRFGPAEWLWRSLTYGSLQPMRLGTART